MIDLEHIARLKQWFNSYAVSFGRGDAFTLKHGHTARVCVECVHLARQLNLSEADCRVAELIGLFHDLGRFEQYQKYNTFSDLQSENHALLALKIIDRESLLNGIAEADLIGSAIANHNKSAIDGGLNARTMLFARLIRDADKIDIWHIKTGYYLNPPVQRKDTIEFNLPDLPNVSQAVYDAAISGHSVCTTDVRTLTDLKVLELSWVFDLNFTPSFTIVKTRGYLDLIRQFLPDTEPLRDIFAMAANFVNSRSS